MIFTCSQIQVSVNVDPLLNTTADCLRFVTEFFDVISQSAPHIYHSALLLAPKSSVVQKLYGQLTCSPAVRIVTGIPESWDSCSATLETIGVIRQTVWSPCGKFAVIFHRVDTVGVWDSTTLERVSDLRPPAMPVKATPLSLTCSHDGHLLACAYSPVQEHNLLVLPLTFSPMLTFSHRLSVCTPPHIVIWDIQTGMVLNNIATWDLGKIIFSWDQTTITLITRFDFHTYDRLNGEQVCEGELPLPSNYNLGACWVHKESLQFAISSKTGQEHVISIQELQPTSNPPFHVVKSFSIPPQKGRFSFSQLLFYASFVSQEEIVILDARDSKILFRANDVPSYGGVGDFSHDGTFYAFVEKERDIQILKHTSTGYVRWSSLRPRFSWDGFSWSPTSISILCWGDSIIQLLHPENFHSPISPIVANHGEHTDYLVAYSADQTYIITTQYGGSTITVLNLSDTTQQLIDTDAAICDIKVVGDTIFVIDRKRFNNSHLMIGGWVNGGHSIRREDTTLHIHMNGLLALSNNCSQVAFTSRKSAFLYDIKAQRVLGDLITDGDDIIHIQFSPNESQLWFIVDLPDDNEKHKCYRVELDRAKDPCFGQVTIEDLEDEWSLDSLFRSPDQCRIVGKRSKWISDPRGNILWLPLNWRKNHGLNARWDGNLLTLLSGYHPEPIIIEFQS